MLRVKDLYLHRLPVNLNVTHNTRAVGCEDEKPSVTFEFLLPDGTFKASKPSKIPFRA